MKVPRALGSAAPALFRLLSDSALNRAALDVCGAAVAIVDAGDPALPIVYANPAFEATFRITVDRVVGSPAIERVAADARDLSAWSPCGGERSRVEFEAHRGDGSRFAAEAVAGEVRGTRGERTHWVLTFTDLERFSAR